MKLRVPWRFWGLPAVLVSTGVVVSLKVAIGDFLGFIIFSMMAAGVMCNLLAMVANDFQMPVKMPVGEVMYEARERGYRSTHCPLTDASRLPLLADRFRVLGSIISVGDILIMSAMILLIAHISGIAFGIFVL